jgi:hypothetical protein
MTAPPTLLSAHPVSPAMRETVLDCLRDLEHRHEVKILFACESGSRGWGFASPDSDYDVRFIYVHRLSWYLSVDARRDVIEQPISGELDVNGWDLRKALQLAKRSNPTLLEWLRSPIIYRRDDVLMQRFTELAYASFSELRGYHHYASMAKKTFREHLHGETVRFKKYLYVLRPLLAARWIRAGRGIPPMRFADLAAATLSDHDLIAEINRLLDVKMRSGEAATSPRWKRLHEFIEAELLALQAGIPVSEEARPAVPLDEFFCQTVCEAEAGM